MQRLIIMGLNSCTFKFDMSLCRERGRNIWYRTNSPFTLWAKLDYLVLLMGEERKKKKKNLSSNAACIEHRVTVCEWM